MTKKPIEDDLKQDLDNAIKLHATKRSELHPFTKKAIKLKQAIIDGKDKDEIQKLLKSFEEGELKFILIDQTLVDIFDYSALKVAVLKAEEGVVRLLIEKMKEVGIAVPSHIITNGVITRSISDRESYKVTRMLFEEVASDHSYRKYHRKEVRQAANSTLSIMMDKGAGNKEIIEVLNICFANKIELEIYGEILDYLTKAKVNDMEDIKGISDVYITVAKILDKYDHLKTPKIDRYLHSLDQRFTELQREDYLDVDSDFSDLLDHPRAFARELQNSSMKELPGLSAVGLDETWSTELIAPSVRYKIVKLGEMLEKTNTDKMLDIDRAKTYLRDLVNRVAMVILECIGRGINSKKLEAAATELVEIAPEGIIDKLKETAKTRIPETIERG